jgi:hypothetical protein
MRVATVVAATFTSFILATGQSRHQSTAASGSGYDDGKVSNFGRYDEGDLVQFRPDGTVFTVKWCGQIVEYNNLHHTWRRVNVYRLDDGFWDCYHEEQLQSAWRW